MVELNKALGGAVLPGLYNFSPAKLQKLTNAMSRVRSGTGRCRIGIVGDSTTMGAGAGSGGTNNVNGAAAKSPPRRLAEALNYIIPAIDGGNFCDHALPDAGMGAIASYDSRVAFAGASWSRSARGPCGNLVTASTGTDAMTFTPTVSCDRFEVWYVTASGFGTFTVTDGSGTLATINSNAATGFAKATISRASSSTAAISIQRNGTGGAIFIGGVIGYSSSVPQVEVWNLGSYGWDTAAFLSNGAAWEPRQSLPVVGCDVWLLNIGLNDRSTSIAAATYGANLSTLIDVLLTTGDVILVGYTPRSGANESLEPDYLAQRQAVALAKNVPYLDLSTRWSSYTEANALGRYYDTVHHTAQGAADVGQAYASLLRLVA